MTLDPRAHQDPASGYRPARMEMIVGTLLLVAGAGVVLVLLFGEGLIQRDRPPAATPPILTKAGLPPSPPEPAALAALERFFEARDVTGKTSTVMNPARIIPMMEDYHQRRGHPFPTMGRVSKGRPVIHHGTPMVFFEVEPYAGSSYAVAMVWDGTRFLLDWGSLTAYGTMDWPEFIESHPASPQTLRVYVHSAGECDSTFQLASGETTFLIEHRDYHDPLQAIAGGETAITLGELTTDRRAPVTIEVGWKKSGEADVAEITRVVAPGWSQ